MSDAPNARSAPCTQSRDRVEVSLSRIKLGVEIRWLHCEGSPELLFTENETNARRLFGIENRTPFVKDGINDYVVHGVKEAVNPEQVGSKAAAHYKLSLGSGETVVIRMRLTDSDFKGTNAFDAFDKTFALRQSEADEFYATVIPQDLSADAQNVMRQGFAGMLWSKQFYHYVVKDWLQGDPDNPSPPQERQDGDAIISGPTCTTRT